MTNSYQAAPGPKPAPLIGNMREMTKLGIIGFGQHVWKEYGDVSRFQFGPMRAHLFVRPEHVKHILVEHRENYTKGASRDKLRMWLGRAILTSVCILACLLFDRFAWPVTHMLAQTSEHVENGGLAYIGLPGQGYGDELTTFGHSGLINHALLVPPATPRPVP